MARVQPGLPATRKLLRAQLQLIAARTFQQRARYGDALRAYAQAAALADQTPLGKTNTTEAAYLSYINAASDARHGIPGADKHLQQAQQNVTQLTQNFSDAIRAVISLSP